MRPALALVALSFARPRVRPPVTMKASERKLTVQIKGTQDTQALLALLRDGGRLKQGKGFNTVHLGATWGQLGKFSRSGGAPERVWLQEHPDALVPLTERTTLMLPKCSPRLLANVAHGMAAVAPDDSAAWRELTRCATPAVLGRMKPMELASLGHALALAHRGDAALFAKLAVEALPRLADFSAAELAGLAWAFARAEGGAPRGGEGGEGGASGGSGAGSAGDADASSAGAIGGKSGAAALDELPPLQLAADEAPSQLLGARARELVRAAAAHEVRLAVTRSLLEGVAREAQRKREQLSPREVSTLCWAFGRLRVPAPDLLDTLCARALPRLCQFTPQGLANTAWGLARAAHVAPEAFDAIAEEVRERLDEFSTQELATLAWSFATARRATPRFFKPLALALQDRAAELAPQGIANTAWAYATAGITAPTLFAALANASLGKLPAFKSQELANLAWAMTQDGHVAPALFDGLIVQA